MNKEESFIHGDYVFTPCKNAFNGKTSWWISKKGYAKALYCFTPMDKRDLEEHLSPEYLRSYEDYFETFLKPMVPAVSKATMETLGTFTSLPEGRIVGWFCGHSLQVFKAAKEVLCVLKG